MNKHNLIQAPISQAGASATAIIAGRAGQRIYVYKIVASLEAAGTVKFSDSGGDLTGPLTLPQGGGFNDSSDNENVPVLKTNVAGSDLTCTSTGGGADGWLLYMYDL